MLNKNVANYLIFLYIVIETYKKFKSTRLNFYANPYITDLYSISVATYSVGHKGSIAYDFLRHDTREQ